jgi:Carboxypeptidase regulatory-like domain
MHKAWLPLMAVLVAACASVPSSSGASLGEPANRTQLWQQVGCPKNGPQQWRVVEMSKLRGVAVVKASTTPLRATIYLRAWPDGDVMKTVADNLGRFRFNVPYGSYEIAICRDGWKPWRGAVRVQPGGLQKFAFELELGS